MCWARWASAAARSVFSLSGRVPAFYSAVLGTLKRGAVFCPLFSAFGPEPIRARLQIGHGVCLVTTRVLFQRKIEGMLADLKDVRAVLLVDGRQEDERGRVKALPRLMADGVGPLPDRCDAA